MKRDVLCRPFPPEQVKQREGQGGKILSYVEAHNVVARLNEACEQGWAFEIIEHQVLDEEVIVVAKLTADGIVKMSFGGSSITRDRAGRPVSIADDLKAAGSDALKKAASLFGVGLEFYGAHVEHSAVLPRAATPAPSSVNDRLTGKQLSTIQSIARRKQIGPGHLSALLDERFGKQDLAHLSRREASSLLSELTHANGTT